MNAKAAIPRSSLAKFQTFAYSSSPRSKGVGGWASYSTSSLTLWVCGAAGKQGLGWPHWLIKWGWLLKAVKPTTLPAESSFEGGFEYKISWSPHHKNIFSATYWPASFKLKMQTYFLLIQKLWIVGLKFYFKYCNNMKPWYRHAMNATKHILILAVSSNWFQLRDFLFSLRASTFFFKEYSKFNLSSSDHQGTLCLALKTRFHSFFHHWHDPQLCISSIFNQRLFWKKKIQIKDSQDSNKFTAKHWCNNW